MSDVGGLFEAILRDPDDDQARLVYADALLERSDPSERARGELIQVQCQLADPALPKERREDLASRSRGLLKKHEKAWLAPFRAAMRSWEWRRGFVDRIEGDGTKFLAGAEKVFAQTPLSTLQLTKMKPPQFELLASTELGTLRMLDLRNQQMKPQSAGLFQSQVLRGVRDLELLCNPLKDEGIAALAGSKHLGSLSVLRMASTEITSQGLDKVTSASFFEQLTRFYVGVPMGWHNRNGAGFGPAAGEMLARGKSLVLLSMIYLHIGDEGLRELVGSPNVSKLEEIHLEGNDITDDGLTLIAEAKHLKSLRRLPNLFHGRSTLDPKGNGAKAVRARFGEEIFEGGRYT